MIPPDVPECLSEVTLKWVEMETEWPPLTDNPYLFYNQTLDIFSVITLNDIEKHFKIYRHELRESIEALDPSNEIDAQMLFRIINRFSYTHWAELKPPS